MCCGLGEEERTKFRKKKKEKKKNKEKKGKIKEKNRKKRNKPHRGQKWVGWDERVYTLMNSMKYFLPYLSRF